MNASKDSILSRGLIILLLLFLTFSNLFAQTDSSKDLPAQFPPVVTPANSTSPATPETMPMDTLKTLKKFTPAGTTGDREINQPKLTDEQLKAITGNDHQEGKDITGHLLYKSKDGRLYYVEDDGAKVYVK